MRCLEFAYFMINPFEGYYKKINERRGGRNFSPICRFKTTQVNGFILSQMEEVEDRFYCPSLDEVNTAIESLKLTETSTINDTPKNL